MIWIVVSKNGMKNKNGWMTRRFDDVGVHASMQNEEHQSALARVSAKNSAKRAHPWMFVKRLRDVFWSWNTVFLYFTFYDTVKCGQSLYRSCLTKLQSWTCSLSCKQNELGICHNIHFCALVGCIYKTSYFLFIFNIFSSVVSFDLFQGIMNDKKVTI